MKFKYERFPPDDDPVYFPTVKIKVINPRTKETSKDYKVLIDSGAANCVLHAFIGESIGIDIKSGEKIPLYGVTEGKGEMFIHKVTIELGGHEMDINVGFSYDLRFPLGGLLGQKGFFEKNRICFDLPVGDFEITPK